MLGVLDALTFGRKVTNRSGAHQRSVPTGRSQKGATASENLSNFGDWRSSHVGVFKRWVPVVGSLYEGSDDLLVHIRCA